MTSTTTVVLKLALLAALLGAGCKARQDSRVNDATPRALEYGEACEALGGVYDPARGSVCTCGDTRVDNVWYPSDKEKEACSRSLADAAAAVAEGAGSFFDQMIGRSDLLFIRQKLAAALGMSPDDPMFQIQFRLYRCAAESLIAAMTAGKPSGDIVSYLDLSVQLIDLIGHLTQGSPAPAPEAAEPAPAATEKVGFATILHGAFRVVMDVAPLQEYFLKYSVSEAQMSAMTKFIAEIRVLNFASTSRIIQHVPRNPATWETQVIKNPLFGVIYDLVESGRLAENFDYVAQQAAKLNPVEVTDLIRRVEFFHGAGSSMSSQALTERFAKMTEIIESFVKSSRQFVASGATTSNRQALRTALNVVFPILRCGAAIVDGTIMLGQEVGGLKRDLDALKASEDAVGRACKDYDAFVACTKTCGGGGPNSEFGKMLAGTACDGDPALQKRFFGLVARAYQGTCYESFCKDDKVDLPRVEAIGQCRISQRFNGVFRDVTAGRDRTVTEFTEECCSDKATNVNACGQLLIE